MPLWQKARVYEYFRVEVSSIIFFTLRRENPPFPPRGHISWSKDL